jgi:hypothetical protein
MSQPKNKSPIDIEALAEKVMHLMREDLRLATHRSPAKQFLHHKRK